MANAGKGAAFLDAEIAKLPKVVDPGDDAGLADLKPLWEKGLPPGDKTGWPELDKFYTVAPGQLTIVSGWPSSGKSEWLDALLINLSRQGWKLAIFSPENQPVRLHVAKMLEKLSGKPFGDGPTQRMTWEEVASHARQLRQSFRFMEIESGTLAPSGVLEAAFPWLDQFGIGYKRGLVMDPWNELEHWRPANLSETEYISKALSGIRNWARINEVHVWIVAHPQKVKREDGKLPIATPDMISGSQHFWNKADCALSVYRDLSNPHSQDVSVYVQKVRFKHIGRIGKVDLQWDRITGRYHEPLSGLQVYGKHRE